MLKILAVRTRAVAISTVFCVGKLPGQEFDRANGVDSVVITATAPPAASLTSPDIETARAEVGTLPGAANVVGTDDLQRGRGAYLEDMLRFQPGVVVQTGQGSEDNRLSIRGSGVQGDDIIGLAVLVDGIPLNQADGEAFLQDVDLQSVRYAEVYRGADALRYGGVTLGGAINLVTVTGRDADPFTARASFGSFGFYEQQLTGGWSQGRWDIYGSVASHVLDGYRDHAEENYQKTFVSLGCRISDAAENRLYFFYGRLDQNNPSGLTKDDLYGHPRDTDPESIRQRWGTRWNYARIMDRYSPPAKSDRFVWQQAYTFSDFRFYENPVYGTHRVAGTPVQFYKGELRYEHPSGFYAGANVERNLVKYPVDEANSLFADPYALLGLRVGYRSRRGLQVSFEARNLSDKVYAATVEPLGDARSNDDTASFNPGNGRAFYGSLSWNF